MNKFGRIIEDMATSIPRSDESSRKKIWLKDRTNYYAALNIPVNSTSEEISSAYFAMKKTFATDNVALYSLLPTIDLQSTIKNFTTAYEILICPRSRVEYDRFMHSEGLFSQDDLSVQSKDQLLREAEERETKEKNSGEAASYETKSLSQKSDTNPHEQMTNSTTVHFDTAGESKGVTTSQHEQIEIVTKKFIPGKTKEKIDAILAREEPQTSGQILTEIRQFLDLQPQDIHRNTKLSLNCINALENNYFDRLPELVYVRGLLRSYLEFLGACKPERIIDRYINEYKSWRKENNI